MIDIAARFTHTQATMFAVDYPSLPGEILQPVQTIWHVATQNELGNAVDLDLIAGAVDQIDSQVADLQRAEILTDKAAAYARGCLYLGRAFQAQGVGNQRATNAWLRNADEQFAAVTQ